MEIFHILIIKVGCPSSICIVLANFNLVTPSHPLQGFPDQKRPDRRILKTFVRAIINLGSMMIHGHNPHRNTVERVPVPQLEFIQVTLLVLSSHGIDSSEDLDPCNRCHRFDTAWSAPLTTEELAHVQVLAKEKRQLGMTPQSDGYHFTSPQNI